MGLFDCFKKSKVERRTETDERSDPHAPVPIQVPVPHVNKELSALHQDYLMLWKTCNIRDSKKNYVSGIVDKINKNRVIYKYIEGETNVPWYVVACLHSKEASLDMEGCLMNGDPIWKKTIHVPEGYGPWDTWKESAVDALEYDKMHLKPYGTIMQILEACEGYNGWGYRKYHKEVKSPYLWAASNHYTKGGYKYDGKFKNNFIQTNPGCATLLKEMESRGIININLEL